MDNTDGQIFVGGIGDVRGIIVGRGISVFIEGGMKKGLIEIDDSVRSCGSSSALTSSSGVISSFISDGILSKMSTLEEE